jgi:hypothetical protein
MKFKYTALGANNQKLEGVLEAESLDAAREQLHKMGLSVVAINEVSAEDAAAAEKQKAAEAKPGEPGIITYYFLAEDPQKKQVNGTIDSKDAYSAFKRLLTEYRFEVLDLYPQKAPDPEAESSKAEFEEWKKQMEDEGIDLTQKPAAGAKGEMEEEGEMMSKEVVEEMDQFIINSKKIISEHSDQYSDELLSEIEKTLNDLERIRASNNLKHITKICNNLFELISNPDAQKAEEGGEGGEAYADTVSKLKGSGFVANRFQFQQLHNLQKKLARFEKVQKFVAKFKKIVNRKKATEIDQNLSSKLKSRRSRWLSKLTRSLKAKKAEKHPSFLGVASKFFAFIKAPNTILRRARKNDMFKAITEWKKYRKLPKKEKAKAPAEEGAMPMEEEAAEKAKRDFSGFFMELDSFVGWLLFFYIAYFFLVSFAIEKNVGLPKELVLKTLGTPLIVNISIFLIIAHLAFTLKIRFFRSNFLGSLFLFFLSFGIYSILIVNF